jgi:hypothetical protein
MEKHQDFEKSELVLESTDPVGLDSAHSKKPLAQRIATFLLRWGIETHGYGSI